MPDGSEHSKIDGRTSEEICDELNTEIAAPVRPRLGWMNDSRKLIEDYEYVSTLQRGLIEESERIENG